MHDFASKFKILMIYDKKDENISKSMDCFAQLFDFTSLIVKNMDCLADRDVFLTNIKKRKCNLAINCFFNQLKDEKRHFISFIRIIDQDIEFMKFELNCSRGFASVGPAIGSKILLALTNVEQNVRSLFTDIFYIPSSYVDKKSISSVFCVEKDGEKLHLSLRSIKNFEYIGPSFDLNLIEQDFVLKAPAPTKKNIKNVKSTNQRKSGRVFVPKQNLVGLKLKKGIFKGSKSL